MNFDPKEYFSRPNDWFKSQLFFEGNATASFSVPLGEIKGMGRMSVPSSQSAFLEISIGELNTANEYDSGLGLVSFLNAEIPVQKGKALVFEPQRDQNPCQTVTLCTPEGIFFSQDVGVYGYHTVNDNTILYLSPHDFIFQPWGARGRPTYWVAPLTNLFTRFPIAPDSLRDHPLRLKLVREVEQGIDRTDWQWKWWAANQSNRLFSFQKNTDSFFVEPMAGYESAEQPERLDLPQITAIAVGELKGRSLSSHKQLIQWFPSDILAPLSFGTGSEVGIPWFETRNERGELLARLHVSIGHSGKSKGNPIFTIHHLREGSGLGEFVSKYLALPTERRRALVTPMNLFLRGTPGSSHVEENLVSVIRAFENLTRQHGLTRLNLGTLLTQQNSVAVAAILGSARNELVKLRKSNQQAMAVDQSRILEKITSRLANAATSESDFGLAVVELTKKYGFPDADVLDVDYVPRVHRKDWASILSELRGATIHEGHIEFRKRHDILEVFKLLRHLHDLLARIIFKECGYAGTYQTHLKQWTNAEPVDWVKRDFDAAKLRFEC
jgi:hypothetical protein